MRHHNIRRAAPLVSNTNQWSTSQDVLYKCNKCACFLSIYMKPGCIWYFMTFSRTIFSFHSGVWLGVWSVTRSHGSVIRHQQCNRKIAGSNPSIGIWFLLSEGNFNWLFWIWCFLAAIVLVEYTIKWYCYIIIFVN